jgi:hypothetical protein
VNRYFDKDSGVSKIVFQLGAWPSETLHLKARHRRLMSLRSHRPSQVNTGVRHQWGNAPPSKKRSHPPVETLRMHLCWMRSTRKVTDPGPLGRTESPRLS